MRITCSATPRGNVYRLYRSSDQFYPALKRLIPFLLKSDADMEVGPTEADGQVLLTVGPFDRQSESEFRDRASRYLS